MHDVGEAISSNLKLERILALQYIFEAFLLHFIVQVFANFDGTIMPLIAYQTFSQIDPKIVLHLKSVDHLLVQVLLATAHVVHYAHLHVLEKVTLDTLKHVRLRLLRVRLRYMTKPCDTRISHMTVNHF